MSNSTLNESIIEEATRTWFGEFGYGIEHGPHESCTLATPGNALLQKLLSGELSVAESATS